MLKTTLIDKEISINDKDCFNRYFEAANVPASEMSFTNLFMWRDHYKIRFGIINDFLCIMSIRDKEEPFCFFPLGDYERSEDLEKTIELLKNYFFQNGWDFRIFRATKEQVDVLGQTDLRFDCIEDRDNFDYVYTVKSLSTLAGKKLDGKRNHINKFKKLYSYEYEAITPDNIGDCKNIVEKWCRQKPDDESLIHERAANLELLDNFEELSLTGGLIKVDGVSEAFAVGEQIGPDTVVVHIEKANADIQGLYTMINQQFIYHEWLHMEFVNREQDLGIEGLRKAKLSYRPHHFVEKYTIKLC
jgi:hypothetical protein